MHYDLSGKSLKEVLEFLKELGYVTRSNYDHSCSDDDCDFLGDDQPNEFFEHDRYEIIPFICGCGNKFYEIVKKRTEEEELEITDFAIKLIDGVEEGLE